MISTQQVQERRLDELLKRQLGPRILAAIADPQITEIIVNEDGRLWFESYGSGMREAGLTLAPSQVESLIGTVAASLGTVANATNPIIEGELPIAAIRFEGLLPPVARKPCCVMRKPAQVPYTLNDYVRNQILSEAHGDVLRSAIDQRHNIVIAGGTGSGKTTLAGALINEMVERSDPNEAWIMLANSSFGAKIEEWLRTLRKKNAAVVLATQSLAEIANSPHRDVILESCPTKLYLPNPEAENAATRDMYRRFGLTDRQIEIVAEATPKRHYYYVSPLGRRLFQFSLGPSALAFIGAGSKDDILSARRMIREHGDVWIVEWLRARGLPDWAEYLRKLRNRGESDLCRVLGTNRSVEFPVNGKVHEEMHQ